MTTWQDVWTRKASKHRIDDYTLESLMELDGYDISCSSVTKSQFIDFANLLMKKLELSPGESALEIGCGAGALCKVFADNGIGIGGVDYTADLVEICKTAIPEGEFKAGEAATFEMPKKDYDAVLSHSVFHYFPTEDYAVEAFRKMVAHTKPGGIIALTDLHDLRLKADHEERRKAMIGEEEYNRLYKELSHIYFHPDLFIPAAEKLCTEFWLEDQFLESESGKFKFNFFARK